MTAIDRAMQGSAQAPLTARQRQRLMGRFIVPAWKDAVDKGLTGESLNEWRVEEQFKACHKSSLRACVQADYARICAHFLRLRGQTEQAREYDLRSACGNSAVARHKLCEAMADARDVIERPEDYAAAISGSKFKTRDLGRLTEKQLWVLVFDLRRAAQRRRKAGRP